MIRPAKFSDIPGVIEVMQDAHRRSVYADSAEFDREDAKQLMARSIQRHGHKNMGGTLVMVSEVNGNIEGFMVAMLDQVYPCLKQMVATDLLFILTEKADSRDARAMLKAIEEWAQDNPKVIELRLGVMDAITDWQRTAKLYRRLGFEQCGGIFNKRFRR